MSRSRILFPSRYILARGPIRSSRWVLLESCALSRKEVAARPLKPLLLRKIGLVGLPLRLHDSRPLSPWNNFARISDRADDLGLWKHGPGAPGLYLETPQTASDRGHVSVVKMVRPKGELENVLKKIHNHHIPFPSVSLPSSTFILCRG